jgi:hypothetical protein
MLTTRPPKPLSGPCRKRADDLLKLSRQQLKMVVAILTRHAPVRKHLCSVWVCLKGILPANSSGGRSKQCSTLFAVARPWLASAIMFLGVWLLNRQTDIQPQLGTAGCSYGAQGCGMWAEYSI